MQQITGIIITLNEANNIESCIESLRQVCSEIIVVDSNSQDQTVALAEAAGARVFRQPYLGDGPQKNFGLQFASHDWVLCLDPDERVTPELRAQIEAARQHGFTGTGGYRFPRLSEYFGKFLRRGNAYPDHVLRLFARRRGGWRGDRGPRIRR